MAYKTLADLFLDAFKDTHFAEQEVWRVLPNFIVKVGNSKLRGILADHLDQTAIHIDRLLECYDHLGCQIDKGRCATVCFILNEAGDFILEIDDKKNLDTVLLATIHAVSHYQMMRYSTLCVWARELGYHKILSDLRHIQQEKWNVVKKLDALPTMFQNMQIVRVH